MREELQILKDMKKNMNKFESYYNVYVKGKRTAGRKDLEGENQMTKRELEMCIDEYGKDIYSFCKRLTNNKLEADDLYQDTFLKAVQCRDKIEYGSNPKSYLLSIALRLWKNKKKICMVLLRRLLEVIIRLFIILPACQAIIRT